MASVMIDARIEVPADVAWALLRDPGAAAAAFPGVLTESRMQDGVRTVVFANGHVLREQIVTVDETRRRIAYAVVGGRFSQHSAAMQILPDGNEACRFAWVSDFLPDEAESLVRGLMQQGAEAFRGAALRRGGRG